MTDIFSWTKPYPLGAHKEQGKLRFAFVSKAESCGILLFDKDTGKMLSKIPFLPGERVGNIYCKMVGGIDAARVTYAFYEGDRLVPDERGRVYPGIPAYGRERKPSAMRAGFPSDDFDWGEDRAPHIPYDRALVYCMHVRGFTKHASSGVEHRGTFAGIVEKLGYLKEIGVTTLELQPAYEFAELSGGEEGMGRIPGTVREQAENGPKRLNYWGYKKGFYYAPKAGYAASGNPVREFKEMVKALHENGMELVMQFYFPAQVKRSEIPEILHFWALEYHVDGFHLMGEDIPAQSLAADDALAGSKLWYYGFNTEELYAPGERPAYPHLAEYNDGWCYDMRRYLKGDEGMLRSVLYDMRYIPNRAGHIHYLADYSGFTLADLVSYDHKHNEDNGEDNRDGSDSNYSWNCGEEGPSRKQRVRKLRVRQIKNAMCFLLLSQSTPLLFMGDEFGNSQKGNNNPYCQDNAVTWLDWNCAVRNRELLSFWKMLVRFRQDHPILHPAAQLRLMDDLACGYPDLSYHGQNAWRPQTESYFRQIGILLCEKYAEPEKDSLLYLAMNMHWESHDLALPRPPRGYRWELAFSTDTDTDGRKEEEDGEQLLARVPPRSVAVYVSVPGEAGKAAGGGPKSLKK